MSPSLGKVFVESDDQEWRFVETRMIYVTPGVPASWKENPPPLSRCGAFRTDGESGDIYTEFVA